jgi:hypothetical protein
MKFLHARPSASPSTLQRISVEELLTHPATRALANVIYVIGAIWIVPCSNSDDRATAGTLVHFLICELQHRSRATYLAHVQSSMWYCICNKRTDTCVSCSLGCHYICFAEVVLIVLSCLGRAIPEEGLIAVFIMSTAELYEVSRRISTETKFLFPKLI